MDWKVHLNFFFYWHLKFLQTFQRMSPLFHFSAFLHRNVQKQQNSGRGERGGGVASSSDCTKKHFWDASGCDFAVESKWKLTGADVLKGSRHFAAIFFPSNDVFKLFFFSLSLQQTENFKARSFSKWPDETSCLLRTSAVLQFISIKAGK